MYNLDKLNGLVVEKCKTKRNFAKKMKLQGKIEFKPSEINLACYILGIAKEDIPIYFFNKKVQIT